MGNARSGSSLDKVVGALEGMGARDGVVCARISDIAAAAGISASTASKRLADLQAAGALEVLGSFGRRKRLLLTGNPPVRKRGKEATEYQLRVLSALRALGAEDGPVTISGAKLAKEAGVGQATAVKSVAFWAREGALEVERGFDDTGRVKPNTYRIVKSET